MRFHYDKKKDAFYIRFAESPYAESNEMDKGVIFDYDKKGRLIGIEILDASKRLSSAFHSQLLRKAIPLKISAGMRG